MTEKINEKITELNDQQAMPDLEEVQVEETITESMENIPPSINFDTYLEPSIINIKKYELDDVPNVDEHLSEEKSELDEDYFVGSNKEKHVVQGKIVRIADREVFVDIGFKSEGIISKSEFRGEIPEVGNAVDVFIVTFEDRHGNLILSKERAEFMMKWAELKEKYDDGGTVSGKIVRRIKGGMVVDFYPVQGFLPGSQVDVKPITNFDEYVGMDSDFKIVKFNEMRQNIVVSRKEILRTDLDGRRKEILVKLEKGAVLMGTVKNITDFGAFIDLGGVDGLLHITDITWGRINHPSERLSIGEDVEVKIIEFDEEKMRVSLGLKQLTDDPWTGAENKYPIDSTVTGTVVNMMNYGAFIEIEEGIEGLIHISEMSWTRHIKHPTDLFKIGDKLDAKVLSIETVEKKISLGLKQLQDNPWDKIEEKYRIDTVHNGIVKNLTQYGAFIQIEEGVDGLVHISDMSWTRTIKHPSDFLTKGDKVDIKILDVSAKDHRLSLGIKQVSQDPWPTMKDKYLLNETYKGKVIEILEKGIIVQLDDVEGIIPLKSTTKEHRDIIEAKLSSNDEIEVTVEDIDMELKKIVLNFNLSDFIPDETTESSDINIQSSSDNQEKESDAKVATEETSIEEKKEDMIENAASEDSSDLDGNAASEDSSDLDESADSEDDKDK